MNMPVQSINPSSFMFRIFFGKNRVLVKALGSSASDSAVDGSYQLGKVHHFIIYV